MGDGVRDNSRWRMDRAVIPANTDGGQLVAHSRRDAFFRSLNARSVAVVGASADPSKLGHRTLRSLLEGGFGGQIYPINPTAEEVLGLECYASLDALPVGIELDLVVVVIPAPGVPSVIDQAGHRGAAAALVISGGFRESGQPALEAELVEVARRYGMLVIGPNVQGIAFVPNCLSALMYPAFTMAGPLAVVGQSGTITAAIAEWAERDGLGVSAVVNLGNMADIDECEVLTWLNEEPSTSSFALYLEGVSDGRRFVETAGRISVEKPVVVLKAGRSDAGRCAVASHTASLAGSDEVFSAACEQYGVQRADDMVELYDAAKAFALLRPPVGRRLLSISSSGGTGALAIDQASRLGLEPVVLSKPYIKALRQLGLSAQASYANPLDTVSLDAAQIAACATLAMEHGLADVVLFAFGDPVPRASDVVREFVDATDCRAIVTYLGGGVTELEEMPRLHRAGIACYPSPERAMKSLAAVAGHYDWLRDRSISA